MMESLEALEAAGHTPRLALLERCVARCAAGGCLPSITARLALVLHFPPCCITHPHTRTPVRACCCRWCRAERAGEREPVKQLLRRLFTNDYRIVGIDAKARWTALRSGCRVDAPVLCRAAVLYRAAVLCCAVLCCAVLCCAVLCWLLSAACFPVCVGLPWCFRRLPPPPPPPRTHGCPALKARRWKPEGGMEMLTGSSSWFRWGSWAALHTGCLPGGCAGCIEAWHVMACLLGDSWSAQVSNTVPPDPCCTALSCSREEVLREMRKDESISRRMTRRNFPQMQRSEQAAQRSAQAGQGHAQEQQQQVVQQ